METGNCTTGNCDKHNTPDRRTIWMHIGKVIPNLRNDISDFVKIPMATPTAMIIKQMPNTGKFCR